LELGFCRSLSVEFISETVRDRRNPSTYYSSINSKKKKQSKLDEKLYIPSKMRNFGIPAPFRSLRNKIPSIAQ